MTLTPYSNRVSGLLESLIGTEDPDDLMLDIMDKLSDTVTPIPDLGNYYTFVYKAKTPNITYDTNPLIAATEYTSMGFKGFNYHWNMVRNYTFPEIVGPMHRVRKSEFEHLRTIPYQKFLTTPP